MYQSLSNLFLRKINLCLLLARRRNNSSKSLNSGFGSVRPLGSWFLVAKNLFYLYTEKRPRKKIIDSAKESKELFMQQRKSQGDVGGNEIKAFDGGFSLGSEEHLFL